MIKRPTQYLYRLFDDSILQLVHSGLIDDEELFATRRELDFVTLDHILV